MKYARLGDLLITTGIITREQLDEALELQSETGERLGTVLQKQGRITEQQLVDALVSQLGVEFVDLHNVSVPAEMAEVLPHSLAKKYRVLPVQATQTEVRLAMADPLNFVAVEEVRAASKRRVVPMIAAASELEAALHRLYAAPEDEGTGQGESPDVRLVNSILHRGCTEGAGEIHLEPSEGRMAVRMRIDGVLRPVLTVPKELQAGVVGHIRQMARLDERGRALPQEGRALMTIRRENVELHVSTLPTLCGERVMVRLLRKTPEQFTLKGVGLAGKGREELLRLLDSPHGALLFAGTENNDVLYAVLDELKSRGLGLISLEDPVEYHMEGVGQVPIDSPGGLTFGAALRGVLHQNPDGIALGDFSDGESAQLALRAALTGPMVLANLPASDACAALSWLLSLGVEPYLAAGAVKGFVTLRSARRLCPNCREEYAATEEEERILGLPKGDYRFYRSRGCPECFHTGYRGRTGVFAVLKASLALRTALRAGQCAEWEAGLRAAEREALADRCRRLVLEGVISVEEAQSV